MGGGRPGPILPDGKPPALQQQRQRRRAALPAAPFSWHPHAWRPAGLPDLALLIRRAAPADRQAKGARLDAASKRCRARTQRGCGGPARQRSPPTAPARAAAQHSREPAPSYVAPRGSSRAWLRRSPRGRTAAPAPPALPHDAHRLSAWPTSSRPAQKAQPLASALQQWRRAHQTAAPGGPLAPVRASSECRSLCRCTSRDAAARRSSAASTCCAAPGASARGAPVPASRSGRAGGGPAGASAASSSSASGMQG